MTRRKRHFKYPLDKVRLAEEMLTYSLNWLWWFCPDVATLTQICKAGVWKGLPIMYRVWQERGRAKRDNKQSGKKPHRRALPSSWNGQDVYCVSYLWGEGKHGKEGWRRKTCHQDAKRRLIRAAIYKKGMPMSKLARKFNVCPSCVSNVLAENQVKWHKPGNSPAFTPEQQARQVKRCPRLSWDIFPANSTKRIVTSMWVELFSLQALGDAWKSCLHVYVSRTRRPPHLKPGTGSRRT